MFHRAGFPEPELNAVVRDAYGGWLLEGDLVWRKQRVIGEYQGADHASIKRRSADASRATRAEAEDYRILEIYAEDVYRGARRRACLTRFARETGPATLLTSGSSEQDMPGIRRRPTGMSCSLDSGGSRAAQVVSTMVVTTSVTEGRRGVEEKPNRQAGSTGASSPSGMPSSAPVSPVTARRSVAP